MVAGVVAMAVSDIGALPADQRGEATATAILGAIIGALVAIVVFGSETARRRWPVRG